MLAQSDKRFAVAALDSDRISRRVADAHVSLPPCGLVEARETGEQEQAVEAEMLLTLRYRVQPLCCEAQQVG